jgi:hypothetical protein
MTAFKALPCGFKSHSTSFYNVPNVVSRGWHHKRYSIIAITLRFDFALLHNALYLWGIIIAFDSYCFRLFVGISASDSYRSELAGKRYCFTSFLL